MSVSLSHCYVAVHDPDAALAFYRDALGLELRSDISSEGFRWVTLSPPEQPELEVVLVEPHAGRGGATATTARPAQARIAQRAELPHRRPREDVRQVRDAGAEIIQEPKDQPWGVTECAFRDPSGTMIRLTQA